MGSRLLFDPEGGAAEILQHLDDSARFRGGREAQARARRDDHIFLPSHQHRAPVRSGRDGIAGGERRASHGGGRSVSMLQLDRAGDLRDPPKRGGEGGVAPEEQGQDEGAQKHESVTFRSSQEGPGAPA
jgi:hypothetical protein